MITEIYFSYIYYRNILLFFKCFYLPYLNIEGILELYNSIFQSLHKIIKNSLKIEKYIFIGNSIL